MKKVIGSTLLAVGAAFALAGCGASASPGVIVTCDVQLTSTDVSNPASELMLVTEHVSYTDPATASTTPEVLSGGEILVKSATVQNAGGAATICKGSCAAGDPGFADKQTIVTDADGTARFTVAGPAASSIYTVVGSQAPASCQATLP